MSDFCERRQHRAKKPHVCELCNRPILPGCEHIFVKGKVEGQFRPIKPTSTATRSLKTM